MGEQESRQIVAWIDEAIANAEDDAKLAQLEATVREFCAGFPTP